MKPFNLKGSAWAIDMGQSHAVTFCRAVVQTLCVLLAVSVSQALLAAPQGDTQTIRNVDFRNFTYDLAPWCGEGFGKTRVRIKDGSYGSQTDWWFGIWEMPGYASIIYGDLTGDGRDEAIVTTSCGGMHATEEPYVFAMKDGRVSLMARLESGDRAFGGYHRISIKDGLVIAERMQGKAACCPELVEMTTYKWNGTAFIQVGAVQGKPFPAKAEETVALHIEGLRNMPKEELTLPSDWLGHWALKDVLKNEREKLRGDREYRFPNEPCYFGAISAGYAATTGNAVMGPLNDLAVDITFAGLSTISMQSATKDALYKFVLDVGSAYLKEENLTVATARSVVERSLGYIIPFLAENYLDKPPELLTASAQSLSREAVRELIKKEGLVTGSSQRNNFNSQTDLGMDAPKTSATVSWFYSPKTHYLVAYLSAECERNGGGFDKGFYLIRFQVEKKLSFGRGPVSGTVEIFSFGTR